ncbi:MAG: serine/threonine protein kinase [Spirirestis rafaelensis WJT71-NPBG6]|jgi:serine/threonine-protein kinase|nr:serine/threonine protein kinase [Spirirestis rafaelensis WJT71-NPBG6]
MKGEKLGGRYQIISNLQRGGFGATFIAVDTQRPGNPKCVVKQLKPLATDPETLREAKRFFDQEAEILERLGKHDQIPQLLAHFEENKEFYLVQEYIEGHDLSEELPLISKQLSEAEVTKLLMEILEVLKFVHQHNVIHRDIKPSNIRRRQSDRKIVLIDFGAVKEVRSLEVNHQGQINFTVAIGTPGYMPSEQAYRNPQFSSDVYAVGIIGIQALTGIYPDSQISSRFSIDPDTGEIIWRNQTKVSPQLAEILDTMVRYDFRQRYPTAKLALQALQQLSSSPIASQSKTLKVNPSTSPQNIPLQKGQVSVNRIPWKFLIRLATVAAVATIILLSPQIIHTRENLLTYENSSFGIKIKYPEAWQRQDVENPVTTEIVTFLSPKQSDADTFQEKLTISVEDFSGTLEESTNTNLI